MSPRIDHRKPAVAFALLAVVALAVIGGSFRARAETAVLAAVPAVVAQGDQTPDLAPAAPNPDTMLPVWPVLGGVTISRLSASERLPAAGTHESALDSRVEGAGQRLSAVPASTTTSAPRARHSGAASARQRPDQPSRAHRQSAGRARAADRPERGGHRGWDRDRSHRSDRGWDRDRSHRSDRGWDRDRSHRSDRGWDRDRSHRGWAHRDRSRGSGNRHSHGDRRQR